MAGSTKKSSNRHETNALISTVAAACPMHPRDPRPKGMNEPAGGGSSANCPPGSHLDGWNLSGFGPHIEGSLWRTYGDTTISWPAKVHRASQLTKSSLEALIQIVKSLDNILYYLEVSQSLLARWGKTCLQNGEIAWGWPETNAGPP